MGMIISRITRLGWMVHCELALTCGVQCTKMVIVEMGWVEQDGQVIILWSVHKVHVE